MRRMVRVGCAAAVAATLVVGTGRVVVEARSPARSARVGRIRHRRPRPPVTTTIAPTPGPTEPATTTTTAAPATTTTTAAPATTTTTTAASTTTTTAAPAPTTTTTTAAPAPTTTTTAAPVSGSLFHTLPVGASLPTEQQCASRVRRTAENRSVNTSFNHVVGSGPNSLYPRVTGNFTGTTDEILQWAACKWGIDEDVVRSQIALESWWQQTTVGDNGESFGLGQVRVPYHQTAFVNDDAKRSSAYNVDYTYAVWRACYDGQFTWLNSVEHTGNYGAGDQWGCLGVWFSGRWHTADAEGYITRVQGYLSQKIWTTPGFAVAA
jgi:hypothetical protein